MRDVPPLSFTSGFSCCLLGQHAGNGVVIVAVLVANNTRYLLIGGGDNSGASAYHGNVLQSSQRQYSSYPYRCAREASVSQYYCTCSCTLFDR